MVNRVFNLHQAAFSCSRTGSGASRWSAGTLMSIVLWLLMEWDNDMTSSKENRSCNSKVQKKCLMSDYYHEIFFPAGVAVAFLSRAFKSSMFTVISPSQYELWAIERYHLHQSFAFFLDVPGTTHRFNSRPLGYLDEGKMVEQVTERWIKLWKSHNYPHRTPLLINLLNPVRNDSPVTLLLLISLLYYKFTWIH